MKWNLDSVSKCSKGKLTKLGIVWKPHTVSEVRKHDSYPQSSASSLIESENGATKMAAVMPYNFGDSIPRRGYLVQQTLAFPCMLVLN